jgi:hypothetical protein
MQPGLACTHTSYWFLLPVDHTPITPARPPAASCRVQQFAKDGCRAFYALHVSGIDVLQTYTSRCDMKIEHNFQKCTWAQTPASTYAACLIKGDDARPAPIALSRVQTHQHSNFPLSCRTSTVCKHASNPWLAHSCGIGLCRWTPHNPGAALPSAGYMLPCNGSRPYQSCDGLIHPRPAA